jgi:indole-3-glycerol phosphate synthase
MALKGFLNKVMSVKADEVKSAKAIVSLESIRNDAEMFQTPPDFLAAMQNSSKDCIGIIAEVKKASPSKGDINPSLDPRECALNYTDAGASAISVLTESTFFKGSLDDLKTVTNHTTLPVLRKDFTIDPYQIYEAKVCGASAILLITTLLSDEQLKEYIDLTRDLGMEPLVEVTAESELESACQCGAKVVDINNRNLQTLKTDLDVSKRMAKIIPDSVVPVEASGIKSYSNILNGIESGIFNFLVGESIVRSGDPVSFIRSLKGQKS